MITSCLSSWERNEQPSPTTTLWLDLRITQGVDWPTWCLGTNYGCMSSYDSSSMLSHQQSTHETVMEKIFIKYLFKPQCHQYKYIVFPCSSRLCLIQEVYFNITTLYWAQFCIQSPLQFPMNILLYYMSHTFSFILVSRQIIVCFSLLVPLSFVGIL